MADPADDSDTDALLARADRLLGRHRRPSAADIPQLTEELPPPAAFTAPAQDDGIPLLTDVIEADPVPAGALPPADLPDVSRAVEQALAGLDAELAPAQREEMRQSLEATLFEQMRKLRAAPATDPAAAPDGDKPPV